MTPQQRQALERVAAQCDDECALAVEEGCTGLRWARTAAHIRRALAMRGPGHTALIERLDTASIHADGDARYVDAHLMREAITALRGEEQGR